LVCGIGSPEERPKRWLVNLEAYIDDSGSSPGEPIFVLAGFISTVEEWAQFSIEWKAVLDRSPGLEYFKMSEAFSRVKQFNELRWTEEAIRDRVMELAQVIAGHAIARVNVTMLKADWDRLIGGRVHPSIDHPYFFCFYQTLLAVVHHQRQHGWDTKIDFIFDEEGELGAETARWYSWFKAAAPKLSYRYLSGPPIHRDDKKFLPLQAADLYAGQIRQFMSLNRTLAVPPNPILKLLWEIQGIERHITYDQMKQALDVVEVAKRKAEERRRK